MERLNVAGVTLEGYSQGGWRTSVHCPEIGAIFDAGTVLPARSDHIFLTHGHPDHCGALFSIISRRSIQEIAKPLEVYLPDRLAVHVERIVEEMHHLFGESRRLDVRVHGVTVGDRLPMRGGFVAEAVKTYHGKAPSIGWAVEQTTQKLKPEYLGLPGPEIGKMRREGVEVTEGRTRTVLAFPGDTKIDFLRYEEKARKAKVLVHEVTVWDRGYSDPRDTRNYGHTHVDEMIESCEMFEGEALVLVHRSMKYPRSEIEGIVQSRFPRSMVPKIHIFDGGDRSI